MDKVFAKLLKFARGSLVSSFVKEGVWSCNGNEGRSIDSAGGC